MDRYSICASAPHGLRSEYVQLFEMTSSRLLTRLAFRSNVYLEQGQHCWASLQRAIHGPISSISQPKVRRILCKMAEWSAELRFGISQVRGSTQSCALSHY